MLAGRRNPGEEDAGVRKELTNAKGTTTSGRDKGIKKNIIRFATVLFHIQLGSSML